MQIYSYTVGPFAENTYLLIEEGSALVIDPGFNEPHELDAAVQQLDEFAAEPVAVVLTHAHVDHVMGLNRVLEHYDLPVYLSDRNRYLWNNYAPQAEMFGFRVEELRAEPLPLPVAPDWKVGPFSFEVRYTPGHAPDHVVLYSEPDGMVIAGDTLFRQGIGRYDLYKGDFETLEGSIRQQLYTLPDETVVYPGHGPQTTIGYEKAHNPFVKGEKTG